MKLNDRQKDLVDAATKARDNAYAPYSKFRVGSAIELKDGRVFVGVNLENSVYPSCMCAERNAAAAAVVAGAKPGDLARVIVVADAVEPATPCGACRQVLAELSDSSLEIVTYNLADGEFEVFRLGDLLPRAFSRDTMPEP